MRDESANETYLSGDVKVKKVEKSRHDSRVSIVLFRATTAGAEINREAISRTVSIPVSHIRWSFFLGVCART